MLKVKILSAKDIYTPLDVPAPARDIYRDNYLRLTKSTGRLLVLDVHDLSRDYLDKILEYDLSKLFELANRTFLGALSVPVGLITYLGADYKNVSYIAHLDGGNMNSVLEMIKNDVPIAGVSCNVYLDKNMRVINSVQVRDIVFNAHQKGLLSVGYFYPLKISKVKLPGVYRQAVGVGFDFIGPDMQSINPEVIPKIEDNVYRNSVVAALKCGIAPINIKGGDKKIFDYYYNLINDVRVRCLFLGEEIFTKPLQEAIKYVNAYAALLLSGEDSKNVKLILDSGNISAGLKELRDKLGI